MMTEETIYTMSTKISVYTNKVLSSGVPPSKTSLIFWCESCKTKLVSPTQAKSHFHSKNHTQKAQKRPIDDGNVFPVQESKKKKLAEKEPIQCKECNVPLNSPSMAEVHYKGKKHLAVVAKLAASEPSTQLENNVVPVQESKKLAEKEPIQCKECNVPLNSPSMAENHYKGKKHLAMIAKLSASKPSIPEVTQTNTNVFSHFCVVCKVMLNSQEQVVQHHIGKRHKQNAELKVDQFVDTMLAAVV